MTEQEKAQDLRTWLASSGLSQTAFAREIHSSVRTVQDWVGEKRAVSYTHLTLPTILLV